ncbi:MAG: hypothetical protein COA78_21930 [Blastopirellula sp.]|nr:MAG: hypothetical protein COA78_21930 [Blastopirellula sp.]
MLEGENNLIIVNDFGLLIGSISPSFWNFEHKIASELFIWQDTTKKEYKADGYEMLKHYDKWAIINQVSESGLTQQNVGKDLEPIFKRLGYKLKELTYSKEHV